MSDDRRHPTAGRRRRHKSPAIGHDTHDLASPSLEDHLRADADGPSCSNDEKGAKRMRSASTTPRSVRGTDPDEYDRVMGATSAGSRETVRFGEEDVSGLDGNQDEVAHNSVGLDETLEGEDLRRGSDSGADEVLKGIGSASLAACLNRMGAQPNTSIPANPGQAMSPNSRQNLPQDQTSPPTSVNIRKHRHQHPRGQNLMLRKNQSLS